MISQSIAKDLCRELKLQALSDISKYGRAELDVMRSPNGALFVTEPQHRGKLLKEGWSLYQYTQFEQGESITIKNLMEELF